MENDLLLGQAQQALEELYQESLIPFQLKVRQMREEQFADSYVIYFYDMRAPSVIVEWDYAKSFKDLVRAAVLKRMAKTKCSSRLK